MVSQIQFLKSRTSEPVILLHEIRIDSSHMHHLGWKSYIIILSEDNGFGEFFSQFFSSLVICTRCRLSEKLLVLMFFGEVFKFSLHYFCSVFASLLFLLFNLSDYLFHTWAQIQILTDVIMLQVASQTLWLDFHILMSLLILHKFVAREGTSIACILGQ